MKLLSFKLQDGKTREEAVNALAAVRDYFEEHGGQSATFLHHADSDTYYVFAPGESLETLKSEGRAMISSGAGDSFFTVIDPPTFQVLDCAVLDL